MFKLLTEFPENGEYTAQQDHPLSQQNVHFAYAEGGVGGSQTQHIWSNRAFEDTLQEPYATQFGETYVGWVAPLDSIQGLGINYHDNTDPYNNDYLTRNSLTANTAPEYVCLKLESWPRTRGENTQDLPWNTVTDASEAEAQKGRDLLLSVLSAMKGQFSQSKVAVWNNFDPGALALAGFDAGWDLSQGAADDWDSKLAQLADFQSQQDWLMFVDYRQRDGNAFGMYNRIEQVSRRANRLFPNKELFVGFWPYWSEADNAPYGNYVLMQKGIEFCKYLYDRRGYPHGALIWQALPRGLSIQ